MGIFSGDYWASRDPFASKRALSDKVAAEGSLEDEKHAFDGVTNPDFKPVDYQGPDNAPDVVPSQATATNAGPSAANGISVNPEYNQAQSAQMSALSNIAARGGRSAASDANLAHIQQNENANAKGQRDAIMQNADARGQGGSGASLLAQLSSSQNATNNQSARDMDVAGQQENTALAAGQGAAGIGANMQRESYGEQANTAAANDAVNRFNAGQSTGVSLNNAGMSNQAGIFNQSQRQGVNNAKAAAYNSGQTMNKYTMPQQTYQDQMGLGAAHAGAYKDAGNFYRDAYGADTGAQAGQNAAIIGGISSVAAQGAKMAGSASSAGAAAAHGGRVPGTPAVPGDSKLNDFVPITTSPGEVVVPRSLASQGSPKDIGSFVKHAPTIRPPGHDKEAMLSALKNISQRRRAV